LACLKSPGGRKKKKKKKKGRELGLRRIAGQSAPDKHGHSVEHITRRMCGGVEPRNRKEWPKNDVEVIVLLGAAAGHRLLRTGLRRVDLLAGLNAKYGAYIIKPACRIVKVDARSGEEHALQLWTCARGRSSTQPKTGGKRARK